MSRSTKDDPLHAAHLAIVDVQRTLEILVEGLSGVDKTVSALHEARRVLIMFGDDDVLDDINAKLSKVFEQLKE